ncbi:hypothetical protein [Pleurocapsa sp. PCC 7319]|uniref:hypothetical protein n=1 Tax=Pleurocapsa sp. PCC 7319 TaxID=118161 RepID=UPI00034D8D8A|nr:hypothetical protein [Pleurocapsa sp. PCC 7319]
MKPKFSTLIILTLITAALLAPFAVSPIYIPILREQAFDVLYFLQGNLFKQITGYISLVFVIIEMLLVARKRGRGWKIKLSVPGSMQLWRSIHIFLGVGLLAVVLIHTIGVTGINFNAIFLWVFFAVSLSALVGVVAETGVIESSQKRFFPMLTTATTDGKKVSGISKGNMIRGMRAFWLSSHIILVALFSVMLLFHIFLAYYYA